MTGLKHFLGNFPDDFLIEGNKGCSSAGYCPRVEDHPRLLETNIAENEI